MTALAVCVGLVLLGVFSSVMKAMREDAAAAEREQALREAIRIKEQQAREMARERTTEDVARDLDAGQF